VWVTGQVATSKTRCAWLNPAGCDAALGLCRSARHEFALRLSRARGSMATERAPAQDPVAERVAENQARFRAANEEISAIAQRGADLPRSPFCASAQTPAASRSCGCRGPNTRRSAQTVAGS
jgi:hypothetical protein